MNARGAHFTAVLTVTLLAACPATDGPPATDGRTGAEGALPTKIGDAAQARRQLADLLVTNRRPAAGDYRRDNFGPAWTDVDGNGCNQRDDVLLRDAVPGTVRVVQDGSCGHDVVAGTWVDPYTGRTLRFDDLKDQVQAQAVQIDHIVPLAEAWTSGADAWSDERRLQFANDLDELLAVDGPTNSSKGDGDPAAWRPRRPYQCQYAIRWIGTKYRWHLRLDLSEQGALEEMLGYC